MSTPFCLLKARSLDSERGATIVENAIVLPVFFFILLATFEMLRLSYYRLSMQFVLTGAMRQISITPMSASEVRAQVTNGLKAYGVRLGATDTITFCSAETYLGANCPENTVSPGKEKELMILAIAKQITDLNIPGLAANAYTLHAQAVGRNEPE